MASRLAGEDVEPQGSTKIETAYCLVEDLDDRT